MKDEKIAAKDENKNDSQIPNHSVENEVENLKGKVESL